MLPSEPEFGQCPKFFSIPRNAHFVLSKYRNDFFFGFRSYDFILSISQNAQIENNNKKKTKNEIKLYFGLHNM